MALTPASPEALEEGQRELRREIRPPVVLAQNTGMAAHNDAVSYFDWRGTRYKVPPLSYQTGAQLQEIQFVIQALAKKEEFLESQGKLDDQEVKVQLLGDLLKCYEQAAVLFHTACYPILFWQRWGYRRRNPFLTCTAQEVMELLSFFFTCRMKSSVVLLGSLANRQSLSLSTQPTN